MKIKVDKDEYNKLLLRVETLEDKVKSSEEYSRVIMKRMREQLENFFDEKCRVIMIKRDKEMIVGELRKQVVDNIFKKIGEEES